MLMSLLLLPLFSHAASWGWPTFAVLSPSTISHLWLSDGCPIGEVKILPNTAVRIESYFIPSNEKWYWVYKGDGQCHTLPESLHYLSYHQTGNRDEGGTITTDYGVARKSVFTFVFAYLPGWDCGPLVGTEPPTYVGCAQDMSASQ